MGKLSDILGDGGFDDINNAFNRTDAADDFAPLPPGEYVAHIASGELETSRTKGTPGYKLTFRVITGPGAATDDNPATGENPETYAGRLFWHDIWLTAAALPMAKRDLAKLGVESLEQLELPLPVGIRCAVKLALRKGDDGAEFNKVKRFDVVGIDEPEADAFAPTDGGGGEIGFDDTSFDFPAKPEAEGGEQ